MTSADRISGLVGVWPPDLASSFSEWVMRVAGIYYASSLPLEAAARVVGCTVAELQGLLRLSALEPERLARLDSTPPPSTTWFLFAGAQSEDEFAAGLTALERTETSVSAFGTVLAAMVERAAPNVYERVLALGSDRFWHLAHKAKEYDALGEKARGFLAQVARLSGSAQKAGRPLLLSPKQRRWLLALLWELADNGVITANSPDDDQAHCDAVLAALGREGRNGNPQL
jgi:hypothetical protein